MSGGFSAVGEGAAMASLAGAAARFNIGLSAAANRAGQLIVRRVQTGMAASSVPSAPGSYSGIRSGQLVGSIDHEVSGARFLRVGSRGAFNKGFDYAIAQHEGTVKMASRPYMHLAVRETEGEVRNLLGSVTFRYIVGGG